jgi:hypothetical protein
LGGSGTISNSVTLQSGAAATDTVGAPLTVTGALGLNNNTLYVNTTNVLGAGSYPLMSYNTNGSSGSFSSAPVISGSGLAPGAVATVVTGGGLVSLQLSLTPTKLSFNLNGNNLTLSWPSNYLGWSLQAQTNWLSTGLGTNWVTVPGSSLVTTTNVPLVATNPAVFYRLMYQP